MRVFNQDKTQELKEYNLNLGHLKQDKLITHIDIHYYENSEEIPPK